MPWIDFCHKKNQRAREKERKRKWREKMKCKQMESEDKHEFIGRHNQQHWEWESHNSKSGMHSGD